jgi:hypothetical protein
MDPGWAWCSDTALWLSQREISESQTTALQMEIYTHHADSRHSWLEVPPIQQLITLGIAHEISPYSYTDGTHAYLNEEDTVTFWRARLPVAHQLPMPHVVKRVTEDPSPVRSLERFTPIPVGVAVLVPE